MRILLRCGILGLTVLGKPVQTNTRPKFSFKQPSKMTITLKNGRQFQIDEQDWEDVKRIKWNIHVMTTGYKYVYAFQKLNGKRKMVYLHRVLMNCGESLFVDHINGNTLDNSRSNLRLSTNKQNQWNQKRIRGVVPYKGVTLENGSFRSRIRINGQKKSLGLFKTAIEASNAYNKASLELHGSYSYTVK